MLPPTNKKHASIEAADWLEEMKPIIGDISNRASKWWEMTVARTWEVYHLWLHSNPLQRIRISPPEPVPWQDLGNEQVVKRLEQRVTTILLTALPSEMRNDLVTSRQLWPSAILYKILRCYQPGGWAERSNLLTDLTSTKAAKDASSAASALRLLASAETTGYRTWCLHPGCFTSSSSFGDSGQSGTPPSLVQNFNISYGSWPG